MAQKTTAWAGAGFALALLLAPGGAEAEVRFGRNVFVGGHDFSHQTFTRRRNAKIYLYQSTPRNAGCRWVARPGGRTKICHLKAKR